MPAVLQHDAVRFVSRAGRTVTLCPCTPADVPLVAAMYRHLSVETLRLRYCCAGLAISGEAEAQRLCGGAPSGRMVALALSDGEVVGIGELDRLDGHRAELAFLVRDDWQEEGIGTALGHWLAATAQELGVERLEAYMLAENRAMRRLAARLPFARRWEASMGEMCVTLEVPAVG